MKKKLALNRETVRTLSPGDLLEAAGGTITGYICYTWYRPTKLPMTDEWFGCGWQTQ